MVESRQDDVLGIVCVFTVVAFVFVLSRIYSRYLGRNFSWDDYIIIFAMVLLLADTIGTWEYILLSGTGYHTWDIPKKTIAQQVVMLRWNVAVQMVYHPLMGSIRASIIMFLFRMKDNRRRIRYSLYVVFLLNILYTIGTTLVNVLQCHPVRYTWSKPAMDHSDANGNIISAGTCIDARTFVLTSCALSIFMDLIIIPIPTVMVWNLQMQLRTKVLVVVVMSLGWVATGVSVGRFIVYYYRFAPSNVDRTWNIGIAISIAEPAVHIMTACAPATKCLFRILFPSFVTQGTSDYYENRTGTHSGTGKVGSRASRKFGNFQFGLSNNGEEDHAVELGTGVRNSRGEVKSESMYDLKARGEGDSRERVDGMGEDRPSLEVLEPSRTSCSKTAYTETSEPLEAEPQHCLGQAK